MRYYTAEWYLKSRCTGLHLYLTECTAEEAKSHEYYERLFALYTEDIRFECEQIKNTSYDVFAEDRTESREFLEDEFARWQADNNPLDAEFHATKRLAEKISRLNSFLPKEITSKIPDMRIFALNRADAATISMIEKYADSCRRFAEETDFRFEEEYQLATEPIPDEIWHEYGFSGGSIKKIIQKGDNISIYIERGKSGSDVTAVHLENAKAERMDDGLDGAEWIYNELYLNDGVYELCALCKNGSRLPEFIFRAKNIRFDYDR